MKYILFFLFLFLSASSFGQSKKEKKAIKTYSVKSVTETVTETVNGKTTTRKDSYTCYDKNANVTLNEEYRKDGTLKHKETAKYDFRGNTLEETIWDAAEITPNPEKYVKHIAKFDEEDNKTEEVEYDAAGKLVSKSQYFYNNSGNKIREETYGVTGKLMKKTEYTYNSKGLKISKMEYDGSGILLSVRKYQYEF